MAEARIIKADGTVTLVTLPEEHNARIDFLKEQVAGYLLDTLALPNDHVMVVDEDAKEKGADFNELATSIAFRAGSINALDHIAGTAIVVPASALD